MAFETHSPRPCSTTNGVVSKRRDSSLDGEDLRLRPLEARREALKQLVAGVDRLLFSEALAADGAVGFAKTCELGLEGIVSTGGSFYRCGRSRNWLKTKNPDFVRT